MCVCLSVGWLFSFLAESCGRASNKIKRSILSFAFYTFASHYIEILPTCKKSELSFMIYGKNVLVISNFLTVVVMNDMTSTYIIYVYMYFISKFKETATR